MINSISIKLNERRKYYIGISATTRQAYTEIDNFIELLELKKETLALIAMLNLKYWCEDEKKIDKNI